ncbi:hypothetical protein [Nitrosomonas sp. Nm132]|uniref:hypothetical protein n=1 Tax=Nitrosomonas sp. Nm132 TaxID=1881053 RepID=UPI00088876EC|nr:hypothetical protein [Nitrosomonas sp. Nm132]SDH27884.1 hypothetical protein SAMN05428952_1009101 [Nitrosomonas sp. Nm132]
MPDPQCPHAMQIGQNSAKIASLEKEIASLTKSQQTSIAELEKKLSKLTAMAQSSAMQVVEDKAKKSGFIRGMHMTATLIGYGIIIVALILAGKVTGGLDMFVRFLGSLDLK